MVEGEQPKKIVWDNYDTIVTKVDAPLDNLKVYQFKLVDKKINFVAGQYVSLIVPGSTPAPFSIASSPEVHDMIELAIEITGGPHTSKINLLKVGDHTTLRGPFGTFTMRGEKKVCYLAGGVGITPFMSMLRWIRDTNPDVEAVLFYSCKVKQQFLWMDELDEMAAKHPNLRIILTVTRETPENWMYRTGRINADLVREIIPNFQEYSFYTCGPPALIDAMFGVMKELGLPEDRLQREKW
jgi:glycine betaine catabolism B